MADSGVHRQMVDILKAQFPTLVITSTYRAGSITATGNLSYHARGMAVDMAPRMEVFEWIRARYPNSKELIFSPAGNRQIRNGAPHMYTGVTRSDHFDHVHWAIDSVGAPAAGAPDTAPVNNPLIPDEVEAVAAFYNYITNPGIWVRIGLALAGAALLILAFLAMSKRGMNVRFG